MDGLDVLEIWTPAFIGLVVGMADVMPDLVALATDTTYLGHCCSFQSNKNIFYPVCLVKSSCPKGKP
jgi:hypothetical protein